MESIFAPFNCLSNFYFRFESANSKITEWSDQTGIAMDQLRYVLCLFMVYPLALIYRKIPSATFKHTIDVIVGVLIAQLVLQSAWIHSFITSTITYFLLCTLPPAYAPVCVFIFNFVRNRFASDCQNAYLFVRATCPHRIYIVSMWITWDGHWISQVLKCF